MSKFAPHSRSHNNPRATSSTICQKCLATGHFIYQCKSSRPYVSRPSRTQMLENPKLIDKASGKPSVEVPLEFKNKTGTADRILEAKEKERQEQDKGKDKQRARKRARRSSSTSSNSSSSSDSDSSSNSESSSDSDSSESDSSSSSSRSRDRRRKRRGRARSFSRSPEVETDDSRGRRY